MTLQEKIAGQVMAALVKDDEEAAVELNLETVWRVIELTVQISVPTITEEIGVSPMKAHVALARISTKVMDQIRAGKKIQAIKELRAVTGIGLKEAKDAIDVIWDEDGITASGAPL